jgi:hypothetical protein
MRFWITLLFALFLATSCLESKDQMLIDDQTYQNMFIEFAIINHMDEKLLRDTTAEELILKVYEHYGVTQEQFQYTHNYFESDITQQLLRMEEILARLRDEREMINEAAESHEKENRESEESMRQRILNR